MYLELEQQLTQRIRELLKGQHGLELERIVVDQPPSVALGEYALPLSFELAKKLRKPPRKIAEEIVAALGPVPGFEKFEVAGAGYINARLDRAAAAKVLLREPVTTPVSSTAEKILVEHTSINPNKAAHIGHLRNAILGDTFVRLLRAAGKRVDVQNYIDNTGVQVADVVVGFLYLEKKSQSDVQKLTAGVGGKPFDYYCWDLYAQVSQWYEEDKDRLKLRLQTLHDIERGGNPAAEIGKLIADAIILCHLKTMQRLDIEYDFLPQESEILHLHFWDLAFEQLKQKGVLYYENQGKNKGCWVMTRVGGKAAAPSETTSEGPDEDAKVIVRSNGTVTYVGKDIAYHLWKFGLLGKDFGYKRLYRYPDGHQVWVSAESGEPDHPHFGGVHAIYNVIDFRQEDPQSSVIDALRGLGYTEQADNQHHFSYKFVVLTPRCAEELGYVLSEEDKARPFVEVSGRKGYGVKADDLMSTLESRATQEVNQRHPEMPDNERRDIGRQIAIGALRYFMLKFTKGTVIAFDFNEALSFEGETGPYCQYAVVRATNIFRKANLNGEEILAGGIDPRFLKEDNEIWELWLRAGQLSHVVEQCIATTEPSYAAKYAFQLAQQFNNFYHKHHILTEPDQAKKQFLLATAAVVRRALISSLQMMGIVSPTVM
ncbi:MAG TPA: arginine--tRNA ligase [Candidatus Angelobacter sp.]|nr:arginine--tRNA ligase [Candidatus Angelobacter sp.]